MKNKNHHNEDYENDDHDLEDEEFPEYIQVTDVLDLHGFYPEQVPEVVNEFIHHARELKLDTVSPTSTLVLVKYNIFNKNLVKSSLHF